MEALLVAITLLILPRTPMGSNAPTDPGSGSITRAGGGAVRVAALGAITNHGSITANGGPGDYYSGSGSGGSVYLECRTLAGTGGTITANGGSYDLGYTKGERCGGGGGRIAVIYNSPAQSNEPIPGITFQAAGGHGAGEVYGERGTFFFPDNQFLTNSVV